MGDSTTNDYFYLPALGASGDAERTVWFNILETTDSEIKLCNTHRSSDGTDHANVVLNDAHRADNTQAHADYLTNNGNDTTSGTLTAAGFIGPLTGAVTGNADTVTTITGLTPDTGIVSDDGTVNPTNLLSNGDFESWSSGTAVAPDGWILTGAGASVARESTIKNIGTYSAKITSASATGYIQRTFQVNAGGASYIQNKIYTFGCWVWSDTANKADIAIDDDASAEVSSSYHTGDSTWQYLTVSYTVDSSATTVRVILRVATGTNIAYFDGAMLVEGASEFAFSPKPAEEGVWADYSATSTIGGWAATPTSSIYTKKIGKTVFVSFSISGTSDANTATFTLPYSLSASNPALRFFTTGYSVDNGAEEATGRCNITTNVVTASRTGGANWTTSGLKNIAGQFFYEAA